MQTLLNTADAARELNLDKWQINRAITRSILQAETVGGGEYRITDEAIQAAMRSSDLDGSPRFRDWLDDRAEMFRGSTFSGGVRQILRDKLPAAMPANDQVIAYTGAIRTLGTRQPPALLVGEDRKLPYDTLAECYCVAQLRQKARTVVGQFSRHRIDLGIRGPLDRLYSSREEYTSITNAAWSRFINGTIGVEKAWPDPKRPGTLIRRYFGLPHKVIPGLVQSQMIRLAF